MHYHLIDDNERSAKQYSEHFLTEFGNKIIFSTLKDFIEKGHFCNILTRIHNSKF